MTKEIIIKNAHCKFFEGQTGLCQAKEFTKCNPVNCKLYTIDELLTIFELQQQLKRAEQKLEKIKGNCNETLLECSCKDPIIDVDCRECTSGGRVEKAKEILQIVEGNENE